MRRAFLSLPLLVAFALLDGCGDADSSAGAGASGAAGLAGGSAGRGGAGGAPGGAGSSGDAGTSAGGASTAGSSGAAGAGGTASCGGNWTAIPGVPKDWVPFSTPDCGCTFYVPPPGGSAANLEWETCPSDGLQGVACQRMKGSVDGQEITMHGVQWSAQPARLQVLRGYPPGPDPTRLELVFAEPAGASAWAIAAPYRPSCRPVPYGPFDGRFAIGTVNEEKKTHGVVAGLQGEGAKVMRSGIPNGDTTSGWGVSSAYLYRAPPGKIWASAWTDADGDLAYDPATDADSLPGFVHYLKGEEAFFKVNSSGYTGFVTWTKSTGVRLLLRTLHDNTRGFMHLGSDGSDLAFTYGEAATAAYEFSRRTLFTAPYTTDPAALKATAKALTAVPRMSAPSMWGVGCGYAAAGASSDAEGVSLVVVRLSDGAWWRKWPKDPFTFGGIRALGVTCDEVILSAGKLAMPTRVRLDSLGEPSPPIPPDIQQPPF